MVRKKILSSKPLDSKEEAFVPNEAELLQEHAIIPLKNVVLLPKSIAPLVVGRARSLKALEYALQKNKELCVVAQRDASQDDPSTRDLFTFGTKASILQILPMPKGMIKVLLEGICRTKIHSIWDEEGVWKARCTDCLENSSASSVQTQALWRNLKTIYKQYVGLQSQIPSSILGTIQEIDNVAQGVDMVASHSSLPFQDRQLLLETLDLEERILTLSALFEREIDILKTQERIKSRVQMQVEKSQREYYLNEQIKAINKELGRDDQAQDLVVLRNQVEAARLPEAVLQKVERELRRLEQMQPLSAEAAVSKNYVEWIISLPWHATSKDRISLAQAQKILDRDHYGLIKVKERILEFVAAKKYNPALSKAPIICLVGPPGVGKTSLAQSIADSLGREFLRISLGGIRDESEIRGHRRTYIGSLPGRIIQGMSTIKTKNPVILLDEIDKMSHDFYGDPAAALLEVLDPEQNKKFTDNFLEVGYDLSHVMFVTTANASDSIPYPLFDRMEVIYLSGYTDNEKLQIAQKFLIPKTFKEYGVSTEQCKIPKTVIELIISQYTREAGVRQLERLISKLVRKIIQQLLTKTMAKKGDTLTGPLTVTISNCKDWLGVPPIKKKLLTDSPKMTGCATGLAWTELGGDVLEIETTIIPGKGELTLTGQLGEVMRESAQAALSYIKSQSSMLKLKKNFFSAHDIHVHIPEGATPKDGPSAGITICTALLSAITNTPVKNQLAMTGEITLRGRVLPVGGLKEKLLAAQQYEMKTILVPHENKDEVEKIETEIKTLPSIHFVRSMEEVLDHVFNKNPLAQM